MTLMANEKKNGEVDQIPLLWCTAKSNHLSRLCFFANSLALCCITEKWYAVRQLAQVCLQIRSQIES